ncbi:hypothetical protein I600_744 [Maribacter dokdonensis DSW-8]|nr:hypothetical protein I600_744 [Maribacter dokdonensis DSW-8]
METTGIENNHNLAYAKQRVLEIKNFYKHLGTFLKLNFLVLLFKIQVFDRFIGDMDLDAKFVYWLEWNIYSIPIIWGVVVAFHALYVFVLKYKDWSVFKPKFLKNWEQERINEILKRNDH